MTLRQAFAWFRLPPLDARSLDVATSADPMHSVPIWPAPQYRMVDAIPAHSGLSALAGFGWMAEVERLDGEKWAELVQKTLARTAGKIDWAHKVAERAASMTPSATTLSIMNRLVRGIADAWDRRGTAEKAAAVLAVAPSLASTPEYERLRTTLLERAAI